MEISFMIKRIKDLWVKALRSGEYNQAQESLYVKRENAYCCMGVLCDLYTKETGLQWVNTCELLPEEVQEWAELYSDNPKTREPGLDSSGQYQSYLNKEATLAYLNDSMKKNFNEIADIIDRDF
jgi:hypothetical protein